MFKLFGSKFFVCITLLWCMSGLISHLYAETISNAADKAATEEIEEEPSSGIFKQIDKNGRVIFTDNPNRERADTEVELKDLNTHKGELAAPPFSQNKSAKKEEEKVVYKVWLQSPKNDEQLGPANKSVNASTGVNRSLPHYIRTQFFWDGSPFGEPQISRNVKIPIDNLMSRGRRSLQAALIDTRTDEVVARSDKINIYVIRP